MQTKWLVAAALFAATTAGVAGCNNSSATGTGGATRPNPDKKDTDINIRTPKGDVDIESKDGGGTTIDIKRKGTGVR